MDQNIASKKSVAIIGAGFSGLITGHYLSKLGIPVHIYEAKSFCGGLIQTRHTALGIVEGAARGIMSSEKVEALLTELGVEVISLKRTSRSKFIFRSHPKRWPLSFLESLKLGYNLVMSRLFKKLPPIPCETIFDWSQRCIGIVPLKYLLEPALQGIYAGDSKQLSATMILGKFFARKTPRGPKCKNPKKKSHKRGLRGTVSAKRGMGQVINALKDSIIKNGGHIHYEQKITASELSEDIKIICVGAQQAGKQLLSLNLNVNQKEFAKNLFNTETLPLTTVTLFWPKAEGSLVGLGCLFADNQGVSSLGVIFNQYMFEDRSDFHSETWIIGGYRQQGIHSLPKGDLIQLVLQDREKLYHRKSTPLATEIWRIEKALPHYTTELERTLQAMDLPKDIYLCGNYLGGIGLSKIVDYSHELCLKIKRDHFEYT